MLLEQLCPPSMIFIVLLFVHLIMEIYDNHLRLAFAKMIIGILIGILLNVLCIIDLDVIAWIIVFLPLIIYTYMTLIIYFAFGTTPEITMKRYEIK
jgi:hypothetical protein